MNKKIYCALYFVCFTMAILVSGCNFDAVKIRPSDSGMDRSQYKAALEQIEQSYAKSGETVLSTQGYYDYLLVESQAPNLPALFSLHNLKTGDRSIVAKTEYIIDTQKTKIIDENNIILYSTGKSYDNAFQSFPFEIHCMRGTEDTNPKADFIQLKKDIRLPIDEHITLHGKAKEEIVDIKVSENGLQIFFGPQSSNDVNFGAYYLDSPETNISYNRAGAEFILKFKDTTIAKSYGNSNSLPYTNNYIKSINLKQSKKSSYMVLQLNGTAQYYFGKKASIEQFDEPDEAGIPYMDIEFFDSNMES